MSGIGGLLFGGRVDALAQALERPLLARDAVIEALVILPFGAEHAVEETRPETVIAGVTGVVQRMVGRAGEDASATPIVVARLQFEIGVTERVDDEVADVPRRDTEEVERYDQIDGGQHA